jgi:hypothetical protein
MTETRREMALRHVMTGDRIIAAQRERLEQLRAAGQNTAEAEDLLRRYERTQAMFVDDLKRLEEGK